VTAGPHLSVISAKRKGEEAVAGPAEGKNGLGQFGPTARVRGKRKKKAAGLGWLRGQKRRKGERDGPAVEKRERRGERFSFFFLNSFSNSFFKPSNFKQTEIHAFKS
jgi:hypothetical protein